MPKILEKNKKDPLRSSGGPKEEGFSTPPPAAPLAEETAGDAALSGLAYLLLHKGVFLAVMDFLSVISCFMFSFYVRFESGLIPLVSPVPADIVKYLSAALVLAVFWVFLLWRSGAYEGGLRGMETPIGQVRQVMVAGFLALAALMVVSFMERTFFLSRTVYVLAAVAAVPVMILVRHLIKTVEGDLSRRCPGIFRIVVAGFGEEARRFAEHFAAGGSLMSIMGFVGTGRENEPERFHGFPVLGTLAEISDLYARDPFDKIVLCPSLLAGGDRAVSDEELFKVINFCEAENISLYNLSRTYDVAVARHEVGSFQGIPLFRIRDAFLFPVYSAVKRGMDVAVSFLGIVLGMPFWLMIALLVKTTSKGPVFYTEYRVGLHGRPFKIYKFRSMVADADARLKDLVDFDDMKEPVFNIRKDPRVTAVGAMLRRTSLDEIPQLLNVLKGEMSLIGPRPERVPIVEMYTPLQRRRLKAKPGITGLQQVISRGDPSLSARIKWDLIYMKQQSLLLDLLILFKTFIVVVRGEGMK